MTIDLAKAKAICEAATPGPWTNTLDDVRAYYPHHDHRMAKASTEANAHFIAFARTALPQAIEEIERLRKLMDERSFEYAAQRPSLEEQVKARSYDELKAQYILERNSAASIRKRLELAEAVCKKASDLDICHYEWCDKVTALAHRREIPPGECDCGVLKFKCAVAAWRAQGGGGG